MPLPLCNRQGVRRRQTYCSDRGWRGKNINLTNVTFKVDPCLTLGGYPVVYSEGKVFKCRESRHHGYCWWDLDVLGYKYN
eukprot:237874-Amorphochlora_amoeboformis.AAC.1